MRSLYRVLRSIVQHPLNADRPMRAIASFVLWQVGSRLVPGPVIVPFVENSVLLAAPGMTAATGNIYSGLYGFEEMAFLLHVLRRGHLFVDVGANVGAYSVLAGAVAGADCIACEPVPSTFKTLQRNVCLNALSLVCDAHQVGLGSRNCWLRFTMDEDATNHVVIGDCDVLKSETVLVPVRTLDDVVGARQPTIVKIDAEGFETEVLDGASETLKKPSLIAMLIQLNGRGARYGYNEQAIHQRMLDLQFFPHAYHPFSRRLVDLQRAKPSSRYTLYIKHKEAVLDLVAQARSFRVLDKEI